MFNPLSFVWNSMTSCMRIIMDTAFESNYMMLLLSCVMALILIVHLKSASILIDDYFQPNIKTVLARQPSPINIVRSLTVQQEQLQQLQWHCYEELPPAILLENNGSTVILRISTAPESTPYICGGALPAKYYFVEAVFKWGSSEHLIDSRKYSLELQVLHATNLPNVPFQYITVSYLFTITRQRNTHLQEIVENLDAIMQAGSVIELPPFDLLSILWPFNKSYYSYRGTYANGNTVLPTQWIICTRPFCIGTRQLAQFGLLQGFNGQPIAKNAREEQPLGNRSVQLNV